jgi:hypothetical protein
MAGVYFTSDDLTLLKQVFEETCARNGLAPDSPAASDLAKALLAAFESGIQGRGDLLKIVDDEERRRVG